MGKIADALSLRGLDPLRAVTSNLVSPQTLLGLRGFLLLFEFVLLVSSIVHQTLIDQKGWMFLAFFTNLTFLGELAYFAVATYHSYRFTRCPQYASPTLRSDSLWTRAHYLLYSTVTVFHLIVPVVYWSVLYKPKKEDTPFSLYVNVGKHGMDFVLVAFEFIFGRMLIVWGTMPWVIGCLIFYMFWAWVVHAINDTWVYHFLNWHKPAGVVTGWYLGLAIGMSLVFILSLYAHRLRDRLFSRVAERVEDQERLQREMRYRMSSVTLEMHEQKLGAPLGATSIAPVDVADTKPTSF
ncbi:hypothetical protein THASP1DRAFT_23664 [Thamnocephalis sphaerospora]|uniref:FAR-17a/AIG1-like protein n=1 Tax=Thamnocephalis sphaerospora TaxID=78915 RepID=A0A4P9XQK1_9FUNG|nr:hypothetical protein THASP1DRAFT_23664 [Thamnocephalis sphaerospora]|eukprot:RKP08324.1 hypothetical protein THASP1DRAFT_23664 [Thamnocephalis sphaerospora]